MPLFIASLALLAFAISLLVATLFVIAGRLRRGRLCRLCGEEVPPVADMQGASR